MGDKLRSQSWVFDLFIVSRTPPIEMFRAYFWLSSQFFEFLTKSPLKSFLLFTNVSKLPCGTSEGTFTHNASGPVSLRELKLRDLFADDNFDFQPERQKPTAS